MNSQQAPSGGRLSLAQSLWLAALSALAGFGAVYLMAQPPDNARVAVQGDIAPAAKPAAGQGGSEMAAFVKTSSPAALPAFTFQDKDGKALTIADFKGKTVLLNLWATWCAPCRHEMPALDRLQAALGSDKFEVVALSLDKDGVDKARKFLGEIKVSHLNFYIDPTGREGFNLKPVGLPTTLLIDANGREIGRLAGPAEWDSEAAKALISAQLK
ncbi:MAG: TlpA disulfide reductase family protein [Hyphomicrobiaceae bacterium]|nr:TlpA disulfide reductase family protein [Hyphomicrobiaceae bacterium]